MLLYDLGVVPWAETQLVYHALARLGREALVLCSPDRPYVSLGFHQDLTQELDLAHCRDRGLPLFRREVGGGAVYLDGQQIFWQLILKKDNPSVSKSREKFYRKFLGPVVAAYQAMGVSARYQYINDVAVGRRRISGTGAGEIGGCVVFVGNIMRGFDCAAMARVLKSPDQGFRDRFQSAMEANLTSLNRELGQAEAARWSGPRISRLLAREFADLLGELKLIEVDRELRQAVEALAREMLSDDWLLFKRKPRPGRQVKVRADLFVQQRSWSTGGGKLTGLYQVEGGRVAKASFSGDLPAAIGASLQDLGSLVEGARVEEIEERLGQFLASPARAAS